MRISDWSSDVCSSDLQRRDVVAPVAAVEADLHGGEAFLGEAFGGLGQRAWIAQHARGGVGAHAVAAPAEQAPHRLAGDLAGEVTEREVEGPAAAVVELDVRPPLVVARHQAPVLAYEQDLLAGHAATRT